MDELTVKEEKFCQLVVELGNQSEAYRQAYNSKGKIASVNVEASKMMAQPKFSLRVKQIRDEVRARNRATLDDILAELDEARQLARDLEQPSAMNQASLGKAKILGFDRQVIDHVSTDGTMSPKAVDGKLVESLISRLEN